MSERRYSDDEVAAIFERATDAQQPARHQVPSPEGMTLADLQDIGRQVGIAPELVTRAAHSIEQAPRSAGRKLLGLPVGVGRTVDFGRRISEEEWERLVVDLRETFDARGRVRNEGSFKQWTNGNLQALLEPTATGHRLRLKTLNGSARSSIIGGLALFGGASAMFIASILSSGAGATWSLTTIGAMAAWGLGVFGYGALRLPRWARLRERQMEAVAARLALDAPSKSPEPDAHAEN